MFVAVATGNILNHLTCICGAAAVGCRRAGGATPRSRSGGRPEKIPLVQGEEQRLRFAGAAVKTYPTSKVRETQVRWSVLQEGIRGQIH